MFYHNFKYTLRVLLKNKPLVFWTFAFPILLGIFFNMAFLNIEDSEKFSPFDIAVVKSDKYENNIVFKAAIENLSSDKSDFKLFNTKYVNNAKAKQLLSDGKITGYLVFDDDNPKIVVAKSGVNETILKNTVEEINQSGKMINDLIKNTSNLDNVSIDYNDIYKSSLAATNKKANIKNISSHNLSYMTIEFYTLIAMTCLYGGIVAMEAINQSLCNMSNKGKRITVSPTKKSTIILSSLLSSYIVQLIGVFLLLVFSSAILHVDFGDNMLLVVLLSVVGSFAGLSLGLFIGSMFKTNESTKIGIIIAVSMLFSFLSGMMGVTMKYVVDKNIPFLNRINPANMITDGFYTLYYYNTLDRYIFNIISLAIFSLLLLVISIINLRRQTYDSL